MYYIVTELERQSTPYDTTEEAIEAAKQTLPKTMTWEIRDDGENVYHIHIGEEKTPRTYREYMEEHDGENLSWCKPYSDDSGEYKLIMYEGIVDSISAPTIEAWRWNDTLTAEVLRDFARAVNPDYNEYKGWTDEHIALEVMHPIGCSACPWFGDCEAMGEETDE